MTVHQLPPTAPGLADDTEEFYGSYATEDAAAAAFDAAIARSQLFDRSFSEVRGYYLAYRPLREDKEARIDRILLPGSRLRDLGWTSAIGVEIKRSGENIGRPICQAIDYTYCAFNVGPYWLHLHNVFLWPLRTQRGAVRSIMVQNGIGCAYDRRNSPLVFELERQVIRLDDDGSLTVHASTSGTKKGSR